MGKFSTYRYLELKDDTSTTQTNVRTRSIQHPRKLRRVFIFLIVIAIFATYFMGLFAGQAQWFDGIAKTLGYESTYHYAIIIDAGSSGSRVLAYKFRVPFTVFGQANLDLVDEYWEQSKPGLSSFADDPAKGADTIVQLIKKAEFLTPPEKRRDTPLIVRATAGLRLLPQEKAYQLIEHVKDAIATLGYDVNPSAVGIMEGSDEGIFIWYTVNLLHDLTDGESMAALDLGGGSTQITYQLNDNERMTIPTMDQYIVPSGGVNITVYTHSYLNLGLLAARYGVLRLESGDNTTDRFTSFCVDPIIQNEPWTYGNKQYYVSGRSRPAGQKKELSYENCHQLMKMYVQKTMDFEPKHAPRGNVAAMSYFYDVAADAGIIDVMKGGSVSVGLYRSSAIRACSASNVEQPWACLDLVYIVALLQDAYKIHDDKPISNTRNEIRQSSQYGNRWAAQRLITQLDSVLALSPIYTTSNFHLEDKSSPGNNPNLA